MEKYKQDYLDNFNLEQYSVIPARHPEACTDCVFSGQNNPFDCKLIKEFDKTNIEEFTFPERGCETDEENYIFVKSVKKILKKL